MAGGRLASWCARAGILVGAFLWLSGCAMVGGMSPADDHRIPQTGKAAAPALPLRVERFQPDRPAPQVAATTGILWEAKISGGGGPKAYEFSLRDDMGRERITQSGPESVWEWRPAEPGHYQVRVSVRDASGDKATVPWSEPFEILPQLSMQSLISARPSPQMATTPIRWSATASGGFGGKTYVFEIARGMKPGNVVQSGADPTLVWVASEAGVYRIRAAVQDSRGNRAQSSWMPFDVAPPLRVEGFAPDRPAPQAARTVPVRWKVRASGGVGALTYLFWTFDGATEVAERKGPSPEWEWRPEEAGRFRVRSVVTDSLGNRAESGWSEEYEVAPPLAVELPAPDRKSPQAARTVMVRWKAHASGGVGSPTYGFLLSDGKKEVEIRKGPSPEWEWHPGSAGRYRVKATMTDSLGNRAESGWSEEYEIAPPLRVEGFAPDRPAPQAAETTTIRWTVRTSGGVGARTYEFRVGVDGDMEAVGKSGPESEWKWTPQEAGAHRIRVVVNDALGNRTESASSEPYRIEPKLEVTSLDASKPSPQMAGTAIRWEVKATGGVGTTTYRFFRKDPAGRETLARSGPEPVWEWAPQETGDHRIRVEAIDERGNIAGRGWPSGYRVSPRLEVASLAPERPSPQSVTTSIPWRAVAAGGVGQLVFDFESRRGGGPGRKEQSGPMSSWEWTPREAGRYEIRVLVRDSLGNSAAGGWSKPFEVEPPLLAILPFENLSASPAPLKEMRASLVERLRKRGVKMLGEEELLALMARLRIRYTGGIDEQTVETFRREAGVGAVLITSLELYSAQPPPKVAIVSRLASTEPLSMVIWADGVSLSGDDAPGFLGLGLVEDVKILMPMALDRLASSLASHLVSGNPSTPVRRAQPRFRPRGLYRSPRLNEGRRYSIAVLPVVNHSLRKNAGELLAGIMIEQLAKTEGFEVLEPGMVRDELLRYRVVAPEGASLDTADLLFDKLKVDLLLTGKVLDYDDTRGTGGVPRVTFFVQVIERQSKEVVWASHSTNLGGEGVYFFDAGKVTTAHSLAKMMVENVVQRMLRDGASPTKTADEAGKMSP